MGVGLLELPIAILSCGGTGGGAEAETICAPGGGAAISIVGAKPSAGVVAVGETDKPTGPVTLPNCWRTISWMRADRSAPHAGQAKVMGLCTMSGVASKAYFPPQSQMTFMTNQGFGLSNTTLVRSGRSNAAAALDIWMLPSVNIKLPPYLW